MAAACPSCGFDNPPGMRFCGQCGTRLPADAPTSPSNFSAEQLGVMMGPNLLERFRQAGLEAAGQRRVVTVLFADLAGYTDLSEQLDAEDLYRLIQQLIGVLANDVYRYEGAVDKFTGDGLMALFGAPIAHENSAELALRSAFDMSADVARFSEAAPGRLRGELRLHLGLHCGPVIVGSIGSSMLMNYTAIGDTVNLARRLQEASAPGTILVSEAVYQQTRAVFEFEAIPPLTLKGINRPVRGYQALGPKDQPGSARGLAGLRAPMIGRGDELRQLAGYVEELTASGRGRFVLLSGEAGMGKSRLLAELRARLESAPVQFLEGHSFTYRRSAAYWIFIDVLRSLLGVSPYTPAVQVQQRLADRVRQTMETRAPDALPYLEHLLSLPHTDPLASARLQTLEAGRLREQTFLAVRELLLGEARRQPVVLILEDLHWADQVSLDLSASLFDALATSPVLILGSTRPSPEGPLTGLLERAEKRLRDRFTRLEIQSLSPDHSELLLLELMRVESLPGALRDQILQRAAGIPFYLEEILRMLIDAGLMRHEAGGWHITPQTDVSALGVPETVQELILARFDRLAEAERRVLQVGAVIGRQFSHDLLQAALGAAASHLGLSGHTPEAVTDQLEAALPQLVKREFVLPLPHATGQEYQFRHALVSDAIYSTMLRRDRSELHGYVGAAIEQVYAGQLEPHTEVLARHFAWSPRLDRALHYSILAGQKAARGYAIEQARAHFEQALGLLSQVEHSLAETLAANTGLGDVLFFLGDYEAARASYQTAVAALPAEPPPGERAALAREASALLRKQSRTFERQGQHDDALESLAAAQRALDVPDLSAPVEMASLIQDIGWIHFRRGNFGQAQALLQEALALVDGTDAYDVIASIYNRLGGLAYSQGDWAQCAMFVRRSIAIRESIGDIVSLADSFNNLGVLEIEMGLFDSALENLTRCHALKRRQGQADGMAIALNNLGLLHIRRGEVDEARAALNEALEIARQIGYTSLLGSILMHFGELHLAGGEWEAGRLALVQANELYHELGVPDQLLEIFRLLAELALTVDDVPEALRWMQQAEAIYAPGDGQRPVLSAIQRGEYMRIRGRLAISQRDWPAAQKWLRECEGVFSDLGNRLYQGRAAFDFGLLARRQGDAQRAQHHFREASLLFRSVGARLEAKLADDALAPVSPH
jgi:predicted ATPase/class 3 adenylate cyclase